MEETPMPDYSDEEVAEGINMLGKYMVIYSLADSTQAYFKAGEMGKLSGLIADTMAHLGSEYGMDPGGVDNDELHSLDSLAADDRQSRWEENK